MYLLKCLRAISKEQLLTVEFSFDIQFYNLSFMCQRNEASQFKLESSLIERTEEGILSSNDTKSDLTRTVHYMFMVTHTIFITFGVLTIHFVPYYIGRVVVICLLVFMVLVSIVFCIINLQKYNLTVVIQSSLLPVKVSYFDTHAKGIDFHFNVIERKPLKEELSTEVEVKDTNSGKTQDHVTMMEIEKLRNELKAQVEMLKNINIVIEPSYTRSSCGVIL